MNSPAPTTTPAPRSVPAAALLFLTLGGVAWLAATFTLIQRPTLLLGPTAAPGMLALAHVLVLGFLSSLLFGCAYIIGPVMAATTLWKRGLAWAHLGAHGLGTLWMVVGFLTNNLVEVGHGGSLVFVGLLLFILNLTITGSHFSRWEPDHLLFHGGLFWLAITGGMAIFLLAAKFLPLTTLEPRILLAAHAHFGFGGFVLLLLLALGLRWLRLQGLPDRPAGAITWMSGTLLQAGLFLVLPALLPGSILPPYLPGVLVAAGTILGLLDVTRLLLTAKRRAEPSVGVVALGLYLLAPVLALAASGPHLLPGSWPGIQGDPNAWTRLYLLLALFGPATIVLTGIGSRLTPQLLWHVWRPSQAATLPLPPVTGPWIIGGTLLLGWLYLGAGLLLAEPLGIRLAAILGFFAFVFFLLGLRPALRRSFASSSESLPLL